MQRQTVLLLAVLLLLLGSWPGAEATMRVVTTIRDLADIARHIGGDLLEVKSLVTGVEDIH